MLTVSTPRHADVRSREEPLGEPARRELAALGGVDPEPVALLGLDPPVVARPRPPGRVVEPPFGSDALRAEGHPPRPQPAPPDEAPGRHRVVPRRQRLGREDLDRPVHPDLLRTARAHPGDPRSPLALRLAREGMTVRDILAHGPINYHPVAFGTPEQVADMLEHWFESGTGNGFNISPDAADGVDDFVDQVVPILQRRGLLRTQYAGTTLRDHLGIPYQNGLPTNHPALRGR